MRLRLRSPLAASRTKGRSSSRFLTKNVPSFAKPQAVIGEFPRNPRLTCALIDSPATLPRRTRLIPR